MPLHTHAAVPAHTALPPSLTSNWSNFRWPRWPASRFCAHFPRPQTPVGKGPSNQGVRRQLRTRETGGLGGGLRPPLRVRSLPAVPLITASSQSSWGSLPPSATRSPQNNGIISGGRGRLGQGLRRRCLLPSTRPSAPNQRLRRPGTCGRADAGGARVAGPGRSNSISGAAAASEQLWARGAQLRAAALCARNPYICIQYLPLSHPHPNSWHLRLPRPLPPCLWPPQKSWEAVWLLVGPRWPAACAPEGREVVFI